VCAPPPPPPRAAALLFPLALALAPAALAVNLTNGDFGTGDFTGWTRDTDGGPGGSRDFSIVGSPGAYAAQLQADYWSDPGNTASTPRNTVLFANTLVQELDTTLSPGAAMRLTFDWLFTGEDGDLASGDTFSVALNDGQGNLYGADGLLGFLIDPSRLYGNGTYSAVLDRTRFGNQAGWFLEVQLGVGVDESGQPNGFGSTVQFSNAALTQFYDAPAPAPLALVLLGLPLLARRARKTRDDAGRVMPPQPQRDEACPITRGGTGHSPRPKRLSRCRTGYAPSTAAGRGIRPVPNVYSVADVCRGPAGPGENVSDGANAPSGPERYPPARDGVSTPSLTFNPSPPPGTARQAR